ncbi:MAG: 16S rRNA (adenine(1518)-N(6)/adenine(1519)-N(6))-dimethyltransferase RsmA [Alphaproteobacteria bacterium]|nr:16S rRNA (adenine(1518)-N(6)/adenine(1519)-N(6))-dimethyltransferase RsmA [Alphaproteobacteria bacterium]
MKKIESLPPVSEMMRASGLEPKKQFGQNFLFDLNLTGRIARAVPDIENSIVIEVGPGPGGLTRALLLAGAHRVVAIEKDKTTEPILSQIESAANGRLKIIYDDALRVNMQEIAGGAFSICANLPYNVGTELLINWLHDIARGVQIKSMTLMFQREVAERIVAHTGDEQYGRLSVLTDLAGDAKILFGVPSTAFVPRPRVESAVVQIIPNAKKIKSIGDIGAVENLTARLFGMRRKMIRGIMRDVDWEKFGLWGTERAEELEPKKFLEIAKKLVA